ncbi:hypothetical protein NW94_21005 [Burkholderia mallei]|nr:hypothetical protein NW91_20305 [Burkholderia mallei]ATE00922.1 hypothetical protein NW92_20915 [Burkholderia mallei]ATE05844.1 hypothetical protein NW93_21215 [Burkholderia mallei]ATE10716.1 hypothetical protein NW94_21005 [Burkholderia mallei]ATE15603.1 hypothetical protein NW95_21070 [Burkholderia mallei]
MGWVALPAPARARGTRTARIEADRRRSGRVRRAGAERMPAARLRRTAQADSAAARRARPRRQSVASSASLSAPIRLSISRFSAMNGGASWIVSPP